MELRYDIIMVYLVCGLPGAGKTYFCSRLIARLEDSFLISSSAIRAEYSLDDLVCCQQRKFLQRVALDRVIESKGYTNIVVDLNLHAKVDRLRFIAELRSHGFFVILNELVNSAYSMAEVIADKAKCEVYNRSNVEIGNVIAYGQMTYERPCWWDVFEVPHEANVVVW